MVCIVDEAGCWMKCDLANESNDLCNVSMPTRRCG